MKLLKLIQELEKPENIYAPGSGPEKETSDKESEILPSGEVVYYDNIRLSNLTKALKKEIKKFDVRNPGKVKNILGINKALDQITNILKQAN